MRVIRKRLGEIYVGLCATLAALVFLPTDRPVLAYHVLFILSFPAGLAAASMILTVGVIVLGPQPETATARYAAFALWVGAVTVQMVVARRLIRLMARSG